MGIQLGPDYSAHISQQIKAQIQGAGGYSGQTRRVSSRKPCLAHHGSWGDGAGAGQLEGFGFLFLSAQSGGAGRTVSGSRGVSAVSVV